jgi:hypothetical protein
LRDLKLDAGQGGVPADCNPSLSMLLAVLASMLRENTSRFERTSDRVAQLAVAREAGAAVELIIAMQDFDRLRQDFDCIAGVLRRCSEQAENDPEGRQPMSMQTIIAEIPVADFRIRLLQSLAWASCTGNGAGDQLDQEVIF